jgi:predicted GTPase
MNDPAPTLPDIEAAGSTEPARIALLHDLEHAAALPGIDIAALDKLRAKLAARIFNLVVAGEFKRGKSSVVNALLGAEVLPTGVVPLTSIVTSLRHGASASADVTFEDGRHAIVAPDALADYVTERSNPANAKQVREVEVTFPAPWLAGGFRLVDTPGIGSAYSRNTDATRAYLPQADAVIFVASVEQPVSHAELQFLADIRVHADRIFCLLNKTDYLTPAELTESVAFATAALRGELGAEVPVFPVSARRALAARATRTDDALAASGFAAFDSALRTFLRRDSDAMQLRSVRQHLARLLAAARLAADLELRALDAPLAELEASLKAFAAKKTEVMRQHSEVDALLATDTQRLVKGKVEPGIAEFKRSLTRRCEDAVPDWLRAAVEQRETSPQVALEQRTVAEVRHAFDAFREREAVGVSADFDRICARFWQRIQQSVDELMHYSAELFAIRFDAITVEPLQSARSHFHYKFWREPTGLSMLEEALVRLLPWPLRRRMLLRRARRRVAELVEMQAGRLRHDLEQRVAQAAGSVRKEMLGRIESTIGAIESALARGRELKATGKAEADAHRVRIAATIAAIANIQQHCAPVL